MDDERGNSCPLESSHGRTGQLLGSLSDALGHQVALRCQDQLDDMGCCYWGSAFAIMLTYNLRRMKLADACHMDGCKEEPHRSEPVWVRRTRGGRELQENVVDGSGVQCMNQHGRACRQIADDPWLAHNTRECGEPRWNTKFAWRSGISASAEGNRRAWDVTEV
jgi:hypothetical protein